METLGDVLELLGRHLGGSWRRFRNLGEEILEIQEVILESRADILEDQGIIFEFWGSVFWRRASNLLKGRRSCHWPRFCVLLMSSWIL